MKVQRALVGENQYVWLVLDSDFAPNVRHAAQYSHCLPDFILANSRNIHHEDKQRILDALQYNENSFHFNEGDLTTDILKKIAHYTNSSFTHYSGNCALLSSCLLFNFKHGRNILAARNCSPFYEGLDGQTARKMIFGEEIIKKYQKFSNVAALESRILRVFENEGERYFIISSEGYSAPIVGEVSHSLNAVVISSGTSNEVVYVDAWKTSQHLYSSQDLQKRYPNGTFTLGYHKGPLTIPTLAVKP